MEGDLSRVEAVLADLRALTGYSSFWAGHFADRTLEMLEDHWGAVEALAEALVDEGRIEGNQVEAIIDRSLIGCASAAATEKNLWARRAGSPG